MQDIAVTVTDAAENTAPVITSLAAASVAENQTAAIDVNATDDTDSEGSGLVYSITGGADQSLFSVDAATGVVTFDSAPDFENPGDANTDNAYQLQVTVTDSGALTDVQDLTVTVTDVDPETSTDGDEDLSTNEDDTVAQSGNLFDNFVDIDPSTAASIVQIVSTTPAPGLTIDFSTGEYSFTPAGSYDALTSAQSPTWSIDYFIDDGDGNTIVSTISAAITGLNDTPTPQDDSAAAPGGVGGTVNVDVLTNDTDPDTGIDPVTGPGIGDTLTLTQIISGPSFGSALIETDQTITYTAGAGFTTGDTLVYEVTDGTETATATLTIGSGAPNAAPVITSLAAASVAENQTAAIDVNATDDVDSEGSGLVYSISGGADQALFSIDAATGVVTFNNAPDFENPGDADTNNAYLLQVTVQDSDGLTDVQDITVTVTDVAENAAPVITSLAAASVAENQTAAIDVNATDDTDSEGSGLVYSISGGADQALFSIDAATGVVTFNNAPDFENPGDADTNNAYLLQVTVQDSDGLTDVQDITISVTDVSEGGNNPQPSDYDNVFIGDENPNPFVGTPQNDWIEGRGDRDNINGGAGDDYIFAGPGNDWYVCGGTGNDIFQFGLGDGDIKIFDFEDGGDKIFLAGDLTFDDLTLSTQVFNGITTTVFTTASGDRLMLRDIQPSQIDEDDFILASSSNTAPVAGDGTATGTNDMDIVGTATATDLDGDALTFSKDTDPSSGSVIVNTDGSYTYMPNLGFVGLDAFDFLVDDGNGGTDTGTIEITVSAPGAPQPGDYTNQFFGDAGNNPIQGTNVDDWIDGGDGRDNINGGAGNDYIIAGPGNDGFVRGGSGADIFEFGLGDETVKIFDFEDGVDLIRLVDGLTFGELTEKVSTFNGITTTSYFSPNGDRLLLRDVTPAQIDLNDIF